MESKNLIEGLQEEIVRVKEMIKEYQSLPKNAGMIASKFMEADVNAAETSIITMDTVQMIRALKLLREYVN